MTDAHWTAPTSWWGDFFRGLGRLAIAVVAVVLIVWLGVATWKWAFGKPPADTAGAARIAALEAQLAARNLLPPPPPSGGQQTVTGGGQQATGGGPVYEIGGHQPNADTHRVAGTQGYRLVPGPPGAPGCLKVATGHERGP